MNAKCALIAWLLMLGGSYAYSNTDVGAPEAMPYVYGDKLDIQRVVRIDVPESATCEVVDGRMDYLATDGELKTVTYRTLSPSCNRS